MLRCCLLPLCCPLPRPRPPLDWPLLLLTLSSCLNTPLTYSGNEPILSTTTNAQISTVKASQRALPIRAKRFCAPLGYTKSSKK
jgi:hypothetical protein